MVASGYSAVYEGDTPLPRYCVSPNLAMRAAGSS